ncbi:hypothetical protein ERJ75_000091600 [Trypanosoma vivax]|nr:hypothetical protein ERJ75_000091600 [Trypanosoma vivax]
MHLAGKIDGLIETMVTYKAGARAEGRGCVTETGKAGNSVDKQDTSVKSCSKPRQTAGTSTLSSPKRRSRRRAAVRLCYTQGCRRRKSGEQQLPVLLNSERRDKRHVQPDEPGRDLGGIWEVASHGTDIKLEQKQTNGEKPNSAAEEKQLGAAHQPRDRT